MIQSSALPFRRLIAGSVISKYQGGFGETGKYEGAAEADFTSKNGYTGQFKLNMMKFRPNKERSKPNTLRFEPNMLRSNP